MHSSDDELCNWQSFDAATQKSQDLIALYRETLKSADKTLARRFEQGVPISTLVQTRAWLIDRLLIRIWSHRMGQHSSGIALVAVGGYGRGELHPGSDIDLLILLSTNPHNPHAKNIEALLLFLWDIGLEVGHSVRTIGDCVEQGIKDITVATNLMEARLIIGSDKLFNAMKAEVGPNKIWPSRDFFQAKLQEQIQRHHRYNDTSYNLEPNIKENPGGLRDLQVIGWVAKRHFGATTLRDLVDHNFLTEQEYNALSECQDFLWKIRFGLHVLTGRREDRLLFDHQRSLANQFKYEDSAGRLAVEHFMKDYYRTVMELNRLNEMLLQLFDEEILYAGEYIEPIPINKRFQQRHGYIEITYPNVFLHYPFAMLEIFLILSQHRELKGVRAETIRSIRSNCHLIDDKFRNDLRCHSLFMEIFRQPTGLTHELRRMNRYGVLAAYLPVFGNIVGQMQHDLFHIYTVDEHTMFAVRNLRRFTVAEFSHEFPFCSRLIKKIPKQELLYLAGFFHDIGKGRGGDHSKLGALDAIDFCQHHGLSNYDTQLVAWLVENHLAMSTTAQRKDIDDPDVIKSFAEHVGNQERLDYLYLLTVADIRATNHTLWNSWKDSLLAELYYGTARAFRRGLSHTPNQQERIVEVKALALQELQAQRYNEDTIKSHWSNMENDYFLRHSVDEIIWHTSSIINGSGKFPLVLVREKTHRGGTELFVCTKDERYIFALITSTLDKLGLGITDARINTSMSHYTLDTFIILEKTGEIITDPHRVEEIKQRLKEVLSQPKLSGAQLTPTRRPLSRQLKHFPIDTRILFYSDENKQRTVMEIICRDQPGLLANIAMALVKCDIRLQNAKIATFGARAEDIFFITDRKNKPITSESRQNELRNAVIEFVDG